MTEYQITKNWYLESYKEDKDILAISFGTTYTKFEWKKTLEERFSELNLSVLYLFDACDIWYHGIYPGLEGQGPHSLKRWLLEIIETNNFKKVICFGSSRGGYGAIMMGCLINADGVLALSPQTNINSEVSKKYGIEERIKNLESITDGYHIDRDEINLKDVVEKYGKNNKTRYKIFYGMNNNLDTIHAKNMESLPNFEFIPINTDSHVIGKYIPKGILFEKMKEISDVV